MKHIQFDPQNPVQAIAMASCLNYDLCADQIYTELVNLGYLKEDGDTIVLQLPETSCLQALEKGLKRWQQKILDKLGDVTVKNYQHFAELIVEVNAEIQGLTAQEMGRYCEVEYAKKYPMFKMTLVDDMIDRLSVEDMDVTEGSNEKQEKGRVSKGEEMECAEELPTKTALIFPLSLQAEVAYALVQLGKMERASVTVQDAIRQIQSVCNIKYVVSPKYILSSVAGKDKTSKVKGDFTVNLHLGGTSSKKACEVSEITKLALILSFPGKNRIFKKYNRRIEQQRMRISLGYNAAQRETSLQIPMYDIKESLKRFQQYIYTHSQDMAQRQRATVVLNDPVVESRCQQKLFSWLDSVNADPNSRLTEEEFSKKMIELSYEMNYWQSDAVIQKLIDLNYLEIQEDKVLYSRNYRSHGHSENNMEIQKFLQRWHTDLKPRDTSKPDTGELPINSSHGRKRTGNALHDMGAKKAKVLDL